jgi:hypothetical protein
MLIEEGETSNSQLSRYDMAVQGSVIFIKAQALELDRFHLKPVFMICCGIMGKLFIPLPLPCAGH